MKTVSGVLAALVCVVSVTSWATTAPITDRMLWRTYPTARCIVRAQGQPEGEKGAWRCVVERAWGDAPSDLVVSWERIAPEARPTGTSATFLFVVPASADSSAWRVMPSEFLTIPNGEAEAVDQYVESIAAAYRENDPVRQDALYWGAMQGYMSTSHEIIRRLLLEDLRTWASPWGRPVASLGGWANIVRATPDVAIRARAEYIVLQATRDMPSAANQRELALTMEADPGFGEFLLRGYPQRRFARDDVFLEAVRRLSSESRDGMSPLAAAAARALEELDDRNAARP